ncbi:MAG TPA: hypothetical protein VIG46_12790 [Candidatus Baltobacteraceae bacterium]|jgi:hypothetical protein
MRTLMPAAVLAAAIVLSGVLPAGAAGGPSCGETTFHGPQGIVFKVLFAKNGAVQRYAIVQSSNNPELDHDIQRSLVREYGPEGSNAPPLTILTYKPGSSGGMLVPDKAVDSCGRISHFQ